MKLTSEAEDDLDNQVKFDRKKIAQEIRDRLSTDRDRDNISYIHKPDFGVEFHRLKLTNNGLNHRIYFDYQDSEPIVFAVRHRDYAYSPEDLKEVENRLNDIETD
ncbi:hypothetical protein [Halobellus rubicundus]|uniref:Type II toxin-antitoxin system RelE/ParE family toxin n=1 Tax=Halobellus rubicundus TaxID=2996466 RepID=A0ABD5M9D9_9EURY